MRTRAAAAFWPGRVRLLLIAEAPPCDTSRYFYFDDVPNHDWLYVYVCRGLFGEVEIAELRARKRAYLTALGDAGVCMIDVAPDGMSNPTTARLKPLVPDLVTRCRTMNPDSIIFIKSAVYDVAFEPLHEAGLPVVDVRMPFPASGQQPAFLRQFARALHQTRLEPPLVAPTPANSVIAR